MLSRFHIKEHAKSSVYGHLMSVFAVMLLASAIPYAVTLFANFRILEGMNMNSSSFDLERFLNDCLVAQLISLVATVINLPLQYCLMRYFLVLSGMSPDQRCPVKVFFSGCENIGAFLKGALALLILNVMSYVGLIVGYFPVFLAFCMAPFYIALNSKIGVFEALKKSCQLMRGYKMESFKLLFEFIVFRIIGVVMTLAGLAVFGSIAQIVSTALFNTALAVIFVRLDMNRTAEEKANEQ